MADTPNPPLHPPSSIWLPLLSILIQEPPTTCNLSCCGKLMTPLTMSGEAFSGLAHQTYTIILKGWRWRDCVQPSCSPDRGCWIFVSLCLIQGLPLGNQRHAIAKAFAHKNLLGFAEMSLLLTTSDANTPWARGCEWCLQTVILKETSLSIHQTLISVCSQGEAFWDKPGLITN